MSGVNGNGRHPFLEELSAAAEKAPQQLPFSPVPTQFQVLQAESAGQSFVLVIAVTPLGQQAYFLPADIARQLATLLQNSAAAAAAGLTVVGNVANTEHDPDEAASS